MDYEKAYNEALERARKAYNAIKPENYGARKIIENAFPELRESEDEKMLRTIIRGFENWKANGMETFNNIKVDDILAYLEKQKETLHIPETCKEKADCFTDEDERIRKWLVNYFMAVERACIHWDISPERIVSYLKRQKEPENVSATTMAPSCWEVEQKEQKQYDDDPFNNPSFLEGFDVGREVQKIFDEPKPAEWSEEDERKRQACISTINEVIDYERERWEDYNPGKPYRPIMKYDEQIDWLKSLRPSWKPSEEQMSALNYFIKLWGNSDDQFEYTKIFNTVKSLCDDLEKRM